ncbi:hypothetical protein KUH03_37865 [Sphingobacterium sp. E70]|nr:MFS transporter [Sphingobacterium sp. E70]ULT24641.1 hypothetical protein KUH03_37865 [Sphingobacterium sp. E70]
MRFQIKDLLHISILSIGIFLFVIDLFIINVSLPTIQHALDLSNSATQWIIILYIIGYASLLINAGNAGDYFGKRNYTYWVWPVLLLRRSYVDCQPISISY